MRILVARYRFIGDTVLMIPFLRNLRYAYPDAVIDVLVGPVSGEVLNDCPYINELIVFDTTRKHRYENKNEEKKSFFSYVKLLKSRKYDKVYVLKRSLSSALLVFLAGIPERIGFNTEGRGILLTKRIPYVKDRHEVECFLDVLRADEIEVKDNHLENWVNQSS
ncbi:MAG: glycosyltransferase family 9 protein, partial [Candidatus Gastranaerophilales bacterium]|nr:glycosyltransferase family 9 protein [Candidatus Gastranaerophilales bacterium]